jgi:ribosome-associated protein
MTDTPGGAHVTDQPAAAAEPDAPASPERAVRQGGSAPGAERDDGGPDARRPGLPARDRPVRPRRRDPGITGPAGRAGDDLAQLSPPLDQEALDLAHRIVDLCADKKASDIVLLDVRMLTTVTDYFVICSGASERQLRAISDGIAEGLRDAGVRAIGREGGASAHWALLDYGSVIVHVMAPPERDYYALEKLWAEAPLLIRVL